MSLRLFFWCLFSFPVTLAGQERVPGLWIRHSDEHLFFQLNSFEQTATWLLQYSRDGESWTDLLFLEGGPGTLGFGAAIARRAVPTGATRSALFRAAKLAGKDQAYRDYLAARMRWREAGLTDYTYVVSDQGQLGYRARYRVEDGAVTSMEVLSDPPSFVTVPDDRTVDDWFEEVARAFDAEAFLVDVDWDEETGYPARAFLDFDERIADEERSWVISELTPLVAGP